MISRSDVRDDVWPFYLEQIRVFKAGVSLRWVKPSKPKRILNTLAWDNGIGLWAIIIIIIINLNLYFFLNNTLTHTHLKKINQ